MTTPASFEIRLQLSHNHLALDDERWTAQVLELTRALSASETGIEIQSGQTLPNMKGFSIGDIVLALTSVGSIKIFLETLQAWLQRDKSRVVEIRMTENKNERTITITANQLDNAAMKALLEGMSKNLRF